MMICSLMGILYMYNEKDYTYIIFPTALLIGGAFSFFDPEDKEYLRRNGIDPIDAWFPDYGYDMYGVCNNNDYSTPNTNHTIIRNSQSYNTDNLETRSNNTTNYSRYIPTVLGDFGGGTKRTYKALAPKCKRNFKITVDKA